MIASLPIFYQMNTIPKKKKKQITWHTTVYMKEWWLRRVKCLCFPSD